MMGRMWRNFKCSLRNKIKELADSIYVATELERLKLHKLAISDWLAFVKSCGSPAFQEKSKKFKEIRVKQTLLHTMSQKGYACLEYDMKKDSSKPSSVSTVDA